MASNKKNISPEAKEAIMEDIHHTSRARQRAAEQAFKWAYNHSKWDRCTDIYEAYEKPSVQKVRAFEYCEQLCRENDGFDFQIIGHNAMTFSVGFRYYGKNTGAACFAYITRDYDSFCFEPVEA